MTCSCDALSAVVSTRRLYLLICVYAVSLLLYLGASRHHSYHANHRPRDLDAAAGLHDDDAAGLHDDAGSAENIADFRSTLPKTPDGQPYKVILYWNGFFRADDFRFGFGFEPFKAANCPVASCFATKDKSVIHAADAVLTHGPVVDPRPPRPLPGQRYVYAQGEPHYDISDDLLPDLHDYYNLTMTYRADSDIRLPYAVITRDPRHSKPPPRPAEILAKKKSVVWVVSHCDTPSKREVYVRELMKHIDVIIYGACGSLHCAKEDNAQCKETFEKHFHFYLSFENDFCVDYSSEKLYQPLRYTLVPIVYGGANYTLDTPPGSVIDVRDYPNPKHLAKHLKTLISGDKAGYLEYLRWKTDGYRIEMDRRAVMAQAMCRLCEILHEGDSYRYRDYRDIWEWWVRDKCDRDMMDKMKETWRR